MNNNLKYLAHNLRNVFLYFIFFFTYSSLYKIEFNRESFFIGLIAFVLSYSPVYFYNDYCDRKDDKKHSRANLYNSTRNKSLFWIIFSIILTIGVISTFLISKIALIVLISLYTLNYLYSAKSLRLRDKPFLGGVMLFLIYPPKWILIAEYMRLDDSLLIPWSLLISSGLAAAYATRIYKRYKYVNNKIENLWFFLYIAALAIAIYQYPKIGWIYAPLIPSLIFIRIFKNKKQVSVLLSQIFYFAYLSIVYILFIR